MIYIGSDHAGFLLKSTIIEHLHSKGVDIEDVGAHELNDDDDYPIFAELLARKITTEDTGILICGSGQGVCIAANKVHGIRAAQAWSVESAKLARTDDDANVLCLGARVQNIDDELEIVEAFINTKYSANERFSRRIKEISDIENS